MMTPLDITHQDLMLATSAPAPFSRQGWLFEPKYDGFRILAERARRGAQKAGGMHRVSFDNPGE